MKSLTVASAYIPCTNAVKSGVNLLYQFKVELSDIDREVYETLEFRLAQHPSEAAPYLLSRTLAYVLNYKQGLEFSPAGLSDPDASALQLLNLNGLAELLIEIGNPSARKLHKLMKSVKQVLVYTYKNPELLVEEIKNNKVHRAEEIKIYAFDPKFLTELENSLVKNNRWAVVHQQGHLDISVGENSISTDISTHTL